MEGIHSALSRDRQKSVEKGLGLGYHGGMEKNFEPLKERLYEICDRLDPEEQAYFRPLIQGFKGSTSEFQRIMLDIGKFGAKIGEGSTFQIYREVQHLFDQGNRGDPGPDG